MESIYKNIKEIRESKGLTQLDISEKLGMQQSNYARLEKGVTAMTIERLQELADIFAMSVVDIINYPQINVGDIDEKLRGLEQQKEELERRNKAMEKDKEIFREMLEKYKKEVEEFKKFENKEMKYQLEKAIFYLNSLMDNFSILIEVLRQVATTDKKTLDKIQQIYKKFLLDKVKIDMEYIVENPEFSETEKSTKTRHIEALYENQADIIRFLQDLIQEMIHLKGIYAKSQIAS